MKILTLAIFILGEGYYGTSNIKTSFSVPMTCFGGENGVSFFAREFNKHNQDTVSFI